ncbi:MAG: DedA family protein [Planctomycetes bacterium]|nr:DedA family protein [Planctomycetota bacterium]
MPIPLLHPLTRWLKRGYDWMLRFADKPYAERALFGLSFAEASFFPLPPDPLLLAMGAGQPRRALRFALVTTVASVLGAMLGYAIGVFLMDSVGDWLLDLYDADRHTWGKIEAWYEENGVVALLLAAITPIPFKVFTIASGAMGFAFLPFVGASLVGRALRFGLEGLLLRSFGAPITAWIERWFDWVAVGFTVLLVGGFLAVKYI